MAEATITCPKCGHPNSRSAPDCENCGITFAIYEAERQAAETQKIEAAKPKEAERPAPAREVFPCPNCGNNVRPDLEDCPSCGVILAKAFEIKERELAAEAPDKLAALKDQRGRHLKALADRRQKEESERAEQLKRKKEQEEALRRKKEEQIRAETLKKQQALEEKAAGLKNQLAQIETQMALGEHAEQLQLREAAFKQQAEADKAKALAEQTETFEKSLAELQRRSKQDVAAALEQNKAELDKKYQAFLQAMEAQKAQALAGQQTTFAKEQETWRKQAEDQIAKALETAQAAFGQQREKWLAEAEVEKEEVLAQQQAAFEAQKAELQKQIDLEVQQALAAQREQMQQALDAEKQQIEARRAEARKRQEADLERNRAMAEAGHLRTAFDPQPTFQALLKKAEGQTIGINFEDANRISKAMLLHAGEDHFCIYSGNSGICRSYPLKAISFAAQAVDGIETEDESGKAVVFLAIWLAA